MNNIIERQTNVFSINLFNMTGAVPSIATFPINLRFAAEELILHTLSYNASSTAAVDVNDVIQIWCNITQDNLITSFPNAGVNNIPVCHSLNKHLCLNNTFQTGNLILQFQQTDGAVSFAPLVIGSNFSYNPQPLISNQNPQRTFGVVTIVIEFIKYDKKIK